MIRSPAAELTKLRKSLTNIDSTRERMDKLYTSKHIKRIDLDSVYEALFLRAVTSFEIFLEELFISTLEGKKQYSKKRVSLNVAFTVKSRQALIDLLLQGSNYMMWLPFPNTEKRAKIYLKDGRPFSELTDGDKSLIKTITITRNAIAHKSPYALNEFQRIVIGSRSLLPGEKNPAGFLRSNTTSSPPTNIFEIYVGELGRLASFLC